MKYQQVYQIIQKHLNKKIPFGLSRIGDGESLLIHTTSTETPKRLNWWLNNQIGYVMDRNELLKVKQLVLEGYSKSNIIGVPTHVHREKHGYYWANAESKLNELAPITKDIPTCSIDIHSELLHSGLINTIIEGQEDLIYISGRNLDEPLKRRFKLNNVYSYIGTPEQRYEANKVKSDYYPKQFNEIIEFINKTDCEGKLCLVGFGMLGKYYVSKLKEAGGIAIDIGHVFDSWYGKITRGVGKGIASQQTKYKL